MDANVILITGNDEARISERAAALVEQIAGPSPDPFAFDVYAETEAGADPQKILDAARSVQSPPFLGGQKTVWLKHCTGFAADGQKTGDLAKSLKTLADVISKGISKDIVLILDGPDAKDKSALRAACNEQGIVEVLNRPEKTDRNWQATMTACIEDAARAKGLVLEHGVTDYLLDVLGTDTSRLDSELEKVICYLGGTQRPATLEDVSQVCVGQGEEYSWTFTNALGSRNLEQALKIIESMTEQNREEDRTCRSLILAAAGFFRQALQIQIFMNQNRVNSPVSLKQMLTTASPAQKKEWSQDGADFAMLHPFRVQKIAEQAVRYKPTDLIAALKKMRDAQWQCISSATSPRVTLENALFAIFNH